MPLFHGKSAASRFAIFITLASASTVACLHESPGASPDAGTFDAGMFDAGGDAPLLGDAGVDTAADAHVATDSAPHVDADANADAGTTQCTIHFTEAFADNSQGWTLGTTWQIGPEISSPTDPPPGALSHPDPTTDHSPSNDNGVAGVSIGGNVGSVPNAHWYLTSPTIDLSAVSTPVILEFWRYLNSDDPQFMKSTVEVFDGAWHTVYQNTGLVTDSAWTKVQYDVSAYKSASFKMRWAYQVGSQGASVCSQWNVDDVRVTSAFDCP